MFRFSSLAALAASAIAPVLALVGGYQLSQVICLVALAALIFWRHSANIARLRAGTEPHIGGKRDAAPEPQAAPEPPAPAE